jgi:hypothetical protein
MTAIKIILSKGDHYKLNFESDEGSIVGTISIRVDGSDERSPKDRRKAAADKFRKLANALCDEIEKFEG